MYRYMILQLTIIEYSSIGYKDNSDFLFGSAFQIMHMHRDLSTYNGDQTHTRAEQKVRRISS